jgi:anaerobic ribonucleoside-triphosphate reductase
MGEIVSNMDNIAKKEVLAIRAEVYSRVVGYYRPVNNWNDGKREEFKDRNYLSREFEENTE